MGIRELMLARIPALHGKEPRYHTQFLQEMLSQYANPTSPTCNFPHQMRTLGGQTLDNYIHETVDPNFRDVSLQTLERLDMIEQCYVLQEVGDIVDYCADATPSGYRPKHRNQLALLWTVWELRQNVPESIVFGKLLPDLFEEFIYKKGDISGSNEGIQLTFFCFLLLIFNRTPTMQEEGYHETDLLNHTFIEGKPDLKAKLVAFETKIGDLQRMIAADMPDQPGLLLATPAFTPLDATALECIIRPNIAGLANHVKQNVYERLVYLATKLMIIHNNLMPDTMHFGKFEGLTRKCFQRLQYLTRDLIHNIIDFREGVNAMVA